MKYSNKFNSKNLLPFAYIPDHQSTAELKYSMVDVLVRRPELTSSTEEQFGDKESEKFHWRFFDEP